MCGGFAFFNGEDFTSRFRVPNQMRRKSYNIRPTMETPVVFLDEGERSVSEMKFGMIPVWAKDKSMGYKLFNARSETIFEKPTWKRPAKSKRCLIPANGFFEWQKREDGKHPLYICPKDQKLFSFAGLYDHWTDKSTGEVIETFAIITTTPNEDMKPIHDRMPVILDQQTEADWLGDENDPGFLASLLKPYPDGMIEHYEVSTLVNSAKNQGEEIIEPLSV